jgi:16S rRNA (cytosine967-C5)-methyltransferase
LVVNTLSTELEKSRSKFIQDYSKMLKKGGKMVYTTCSILPSENNEQVNEFLKNNPNFKFIKEEKILPSEGYDVFYIALVERVS